MKNIPVNKFRRCGKCYGKKIWEKYHEYSQKPEDILDKLLREILRKAQEKCHAIGKEDICLEVTGCDKFPGKSTRIAYKEISILIWSLENFSITAKNFLSIMQYADNHETDIAHIDNLLKSNDIEDRYKFIRPAAVYGI